MRIRHVAGFKLLVVDAFLFWVSAVYRDMTPTQRKRSRVETVHVFIVITEQFHCTAVGAHTIAATTHSYTQSIDLQDPAFIS